MYINVWKMGEKGDYKSNPGSPKIKCKKEEGKIKKPLL